MMTLTNLRKINMTADVEKFIKVVVLFVIVSFSILGFNTYTKIVHKKETQKQTAICPALLSIGRSSRDTLIVMKAEPLCDKFVLDNLK
jgi:hypothetical protein